jgi:hypothetical protein
VDGRRAPNCAGTLISCLLHFSLILGVKEK